MPFLPLLVRAAPTGLPAGVPTDGSIPPAILSRIQAEAAAAASSVGTSIMTAAGGSMTSATGIALPTGTNGPPSGFSIPAGMTGPPAGFATMTGPPGRLPTGFLTGGGGGPPHRITDHRTRAMIGTAAMWLVLTTSVVLGRFISRRMVKQKIGADDYCSLVSLGILIGLLSEQFAIARLNQNLKTPYAPMSFGRLHLISTILYVCIITTARVSVLLLYRRVFTLRIKWFRIAWWISLAICVAYWITWFIMSFTSCTPHPLKSLWTAPWLCHESIGSISAGGFLNVAIDSLLLALPIRMIWLLQMSKKQKFAVSGVFALGLMYVALFLSHVVLGASTRKLTLIPLQRRRNLSCTSHIGPQCLNLYNRPRKLHLLVHSRTLCDSDLRLPPSDAAPLALHHQTRPLLLLHPNAPLFNTQARLRQQLRLQ